MTTYHFNDSNLVFGTMPLLKEMKCSLRDVYFQRHNRNLVKMVMVWSDKKTSQSMLGVFNIGPLVPKFLQGSTPEEPTHT